MKDKEDAFKVDVFLNDKWVPYLLTEKFSLFLAKKILKMNPLNSEFVWFEKGKLKTVEDAKNNIKHIFSFSRGWPTLQTNSTSMLGETNPMQSNNNI